MCEEIDGQMEALVPRRAAVLGLKVADEAEADTVQRVTKAVLALAALLVVHFFVHLANEGHIKHGLVHLCVSFLLPALGYHAVQKRSSRAVWMFHVGVAFTTLLHGIVLFMVLLHVSGLAHKDPGVECSSLVAPAHKCPPSAEWTERGQPSSDGRFWRCNGGFCIALAGRCNGEFNCYDHSDELTCPTPAPQDTPPAAAPGRDREAEEQARLKCVKKMEREKFRGPKLKWWWIIVSMPLWGLSAYAAYHSLEFYVQLRVKKLDVRIGSQGTAVTVFERAEE